MNKQVRTRVKTEVQQLVEEAPNKAMKLSSSGHTFVLVPGGGRCEQGVTSVNEADYSKNIGRKI